MPILLIGGGTEAMKPVRDKTAKHAGFFLILLTIATFSLRGQQLPWAVFAAESSPSDDAILLEVLPKLDLTEALAVARALPTRSDPNLRTVVWGLLSAELTARDELFVRVTLESITSLAPPTREPAVERNAETLQLLFEHMSRLDSPMLRAAVWRLAALSPQPLRREILPSARSAAASLLQRAENRGNQSRRHQSSSGELPSTMAPLSPSPEGGSESRAYSQETHEALAFFSYARITSDRTLTVIIDELRAASREPVLVRAAREALGEMD